MKTDTVLYINQDLLILRGDFVQTFLDQYKSEETKRAYKYDILEFFQTSNTNQIKLSMIQHITGKQAQDYIKEISKTNTISTINRKLSALSSLINYVNFLGLSCDIYVSNIFENPFLRKIVDNQSQKKNKEIDTFKPHEIEQILSVAKGKGNMRDYVLLKFLFNSMARRDEIVNIYPEDIFQTTNKKGEVEYGIVLRKAKGRKERTIYISKEMKELLDQITFSSGCPIFHCTGDNIYKILKKYCKLAGIQKKQISPHIARHSSASIAKENGASTTQIKDTLGHSDERTTEGYIHDSNKFKECATRYVNF